MSSRDIKIDNRWVVRTLTVGLYVMGRAFALDGKSVVSGDRDSGRKATVLGCQRAV